MRANSEIVIEDVDESPSELLLEVIQNAQRGERKLLRRQDPERARRAFGRARSLSVMLLPVIADEYDLNEEQVKKFIGRDIRSMNDTLMEIKKRMMIARVQQQQRGDALIKEDTLMDIREIITDLEDFYDLVIGIEEGRARVIE